MATKVKCTYDLAPSIDMFALILSGFTCPVEIRYHDRPCVKVCMTCAEDFPGEQHQQLLFVGGGKADGSLWVYVLPPTLQPGFTITMGNSVQFVKEPFNCTITKVVIWIPVPCSVCTNDVQIVDKDALTFPGPRPTVFRS